MDETVLKVGIAGFMHDIGKLADDKAFFVSQDFINSNAALYQPFYEGHHTHRHAVYTATFIDYIQKLLPKKPNQAQWGLEDPFINLAAGHHKPETPLQWIIAMADRISSGWDRARFEEEYNRAVTPKDYRRTRLLPLFERLLVETENPPETATSYSCCYPLKEVSAKNIFPVPVKEGRPEKDEVAAQEYKMLFDDFVFALEGLFHKEENLALWLDHFESLMMIFTSSLPAARVGHVIPDVSLYDHLKTTAALSVSLYLYHRDRKDLSVESIQHEELQKFLFVTGDFYGIQNFIFSESGETQKNRSKILRGRSFAVPLFSELGADMLCREIGIPSLSVVYNTAGKFMVLAPNTGHAKDAVKQVETKVNDWLMKVSFGENAIGMSWIEASPRDLTGGNFINVWDTIARRMEVKKYHKIDLERFGGTVVDYLDGFTNDLEHPLCPFCRKRPSCSEAEGSNLIGEDQSACKVCRDHIFLGANLVKKNRIAIATKEADLKGQDWKLLEPIFGYYQVAFVDGELKEMARQGHLLKYWDISIDPIGKVAKEVTAKFINGYVPVYQEEDLRDERLLAGKRSDEKKAELIEALHEGIPKTFSHIANKSLNLKKDGKGVEGVGALGVFKADVDRMGLLMSCGLTQKRFTLSRLVTLSRQMNWYFTLYVPFLLKTSPAFKDVYTVFAGGDDLFLIAPWNRIVDLAEVIQETFERYVCRNPHIHLSAGMSLQKPHTPLSRLSRETEKSLEKSKERKGKNSVTLFSETADWKEFKQLRAIRKTLEEWFQKGLVNKAMIYRLNEFIEMADNEKRVLKAKEISMEHIQCLKWRSLFHYTSQRNVGRGLKAKEKQEAINDFVKAAQWLEECGGKLRIALWDMIYNYRKEG